MNRYRLMVAPGFDLDLLVDFARELSRRGLDVTVDFTRALAALHPLPDGADAHGARSAGCLPD